MRRQFLFFILCFFRFQSFTFFYLFWDSLFIRKKSENYKVLKCLNLQFLKQNFYIFQIFVKNLQLFLRRLHFLKNGAAAATAVTVPLAPAPPFSSVFDTKKGGKHIRIH